MNRTLWISLAIVAATWLGNVGAAEARFSRNNPYRSFNLSGYNYGSMQWEKSHRKESQTPKHHGSFWLRRR